MTREEKNREARCRRMATRLGYRLLKSRRRDPNAWDYGTYGVNDAETNCVVYADWTMQNGLGLDLDDVEDWLSGGETEQVPDDGLERIGDASRR